MFWIFMFFANLLFAERNFLGPENCACGNGKQELIGHDNINHCPYLLYGISTQNGESSLYSFNTNNGMGYYVASVSNVKDIQAMDFSPNGVLYIVGKNNENQEVLATLDCKTGMSNIIGLTNTPSPISSVNFDSHGQLYAFILEQPGDVFEDGHLIRLNLGTGAYSNELHTYENHLGNAIGFGNLAFDHLYHAGNEDLTFLNQYTGEPTPLGDIGFVAPLINRARINDMDLDPLTGILWSSIDDMPSGMGAPFINYLGFLNLNGNQVFYPKFPPNKAPDGLFALSVNRPYEACDGNENLPVGTACSADCSNIIENACNDNEDNDFDGLYDCQDPDCNNKSCDGPTSCNEGGVCVSGACEGSIEKNCDDDNDCTTDACTNGVCNNEPNVGSSCDDKNPCTDESCDEDGKCIAIPNNENLCDDEDICTYYSFCLDGVCIGENLENDCEDGLDNDCDGLIDGDDKDCEVIQNIELDCDDGIDNDGDENIDCYDDDCYEKPCQINVNTCVDYICGDINNIGCNAIYNNGSCDDLNACTIGDYCSSGACISGTQKNCDDDNVCTSDFCSLGVCSHTSLTGNACDSDNNDCTDDICNNGLCEYINDNTNSCSDNIACTISDHCSDGECISAGVPEICNNGIDDDCDKKTDKEDPDCASEALYIFVTKNTYSANLGGVLGADAKCQSAADLAGRAGTFKAIISASGYNIVDHITPTNEPWYLFSGVPNKIADDLEDLFDESIQQAINVDEYGNDVSVSDKKFVWTGTESNGKYTGNACNNWTTSLANKKGTQGTIDKIDEKWIHQNDATCSQSYRLYCIQVNP